MKIALGMRNFSPEKGGAERSMAELMSFLSKEGHEVHIFANQFGKLNDSFFVHRVPIIHFPKSLKVLSFALVCHQKIKQEDFDVVIGVGNTFRANLLQPRGGVHWCWFWRSLRAYDNPWIWGVKFLGRILSPKQWAEGIVENAPYRAGVKRIVAISEMVKEDIIDCYGIHESQIKVIYNGVDTEQFHPRNRRYREEIRERYGLSLRDFLLLFVSHNFRLKGLRYLIQSLSLVREKKDNVKLLVVGRDKESPYLGLVKKMGCEKDVVFTGHVHDLERYYPSADVLVHPTFYDSFSRVVLEALASGLPVITTRYCGAGCIISEGKEGFVLDDPRDVNALAKKIVTLSNPSKLKEASLAASRLGQKYSQQRCHDDMLKVLQELRR